jgi:DoxX-like family
VATSRDSIPKWQFVTGWVLSGILALVFLPSAFFKITQPPGFLDGWTKSYPAGAARPLGLIEVTMFVLYLVPKTRYLGGLIMLAYLGGAVATHLHTEDGKFFVPIIVGTIAWLGLFLRDQRLRALVPLAEA